MNLRQFIFTENKCYKAGWTMTPKGIMVHSTGANNPWLKRYVCPDDGLLGVNTAGNHWNTAKPEGNSVCVHAFIGRLADGSIATYQTLPWNMRGWHCGGKANDTHIGFEICEDDLSDEMYLSKVTREVVELCATLCREYGLAPLADGVLICHSEGYAQGIASGHDDVMHWWPRHGLSMDTFRAAVVAEMEDDLTKEQVREIIKEYEAEKATNAPSDWSRDAREWAEANGIIAGDTVQESMHARTDGNFLVPPVQSYKKTVWKLSLFS
jgi:hypothetical protein